MSYLLFPSVVVVIMSFSDGTFLEFPPSRISLKWYRSFFGDPSWTEAAWTSTQIAIVVAVLSTVVGTLAAYGLNRSSSRLRSFLTTVILAPITFPSIVVGIAAYLGLLNLGLIGTQTGIILTHSIGACAYVVVIVSATLANFDRRLEQAGQSMRAGPLQTFRRITLPLIRPGVIGGALFAFIHSFDEVVKTSLVSGFFEDVGEHAKPNRSDDRRGGIAAHIVARTLANRHLRHGLAAKAERSWRGSRAGSVSGAAGTHSRWFWPGSKPQRSSPVIDGRLGSVLIRDETARRRSVALDGREP
ncbi:ABC transporter permease [Bradyrhizobium sp. 192]|uniref:ABC transporter permease n=1 Tax=Bradyrhizobium sp. 192 TaxID=2782660 RepID=UPI003211D2EA